MKLDKQFDFDVVLKAEGDYGSFEGLAGVYGNVDSQGDKILKGAFAGDHGREVPILWAHQRDQVIGLGTLEDTPQGLTVKGRFLLDTTAGREAYVRAKSRAARGLSVGFRILQQGAEAGVRLIRAATTFEVSLTAFPANEQAAVVAVKGERSPLRELSAFI